ncbi:MAG: hypothetical protein HY908_35280 [Myxococcales bacterium]|nr:hypothetical protein [Myxococcales bacterium]
MTTPRRYTIALVGVSVAVAEVCTAALTAWGRLRPLRAISSDGLADSSIAIVELAAPMAESIACFCRVRRCNPAIPIVLLGPALHAEVAVELVKCGADEYLTIPFNPEGLARKVGRCLRERYGPVFDIPGLEALFPKQAGFEGVNHRRAFRAMVPRGLAASVRVVTGAASSVSGQRLAVRDIGPAVDDAPGGMRLVADPVTAAELGVLEWEVGRQLELSAQVDDGDPVELVATLVRPAQFGRERSVELGIVYTPVHRSGTARMQRFWYACQRRGDPLPG